MSARILTVAAVLTSLALHSAVGQAKPNFSGSWKINTEKSDPMGGGGGGGGGGMNMGALVITQTATDLTTEQTFGDQVRKASYYLDGRESTNPGRSGDAKSKASWEGNSLVIETTSMMGENTVTTKSVRSLSDDGKTMTVVTTRPGPNGETTRKTVYDKQ